jgi:DNA topoisomerase III
MKVVIAEKPSVAREIAILLGASEKKEGYLIGNGYCVTWAFGHLISLGMPEDYGISAFQKTSLPILPNPYLLTVKKIKKERVYLADIGALKQLKIIEQLINNCDSIIVATDAGREGELIFRYIYEFLNCQKPFQRLWISSLTVKAIREGFANLKPGKEFDSLYYAAQSRSRADWLVGINASQALSIAAGNGIYSLGRVQTPTLALICKRYQENKAFSIQTYWQLQLEHQKGYINFKSLSNSKWNDKKLAEEALKSIQRSGVAIVTSIERKTVIEQPPLLYDLTGLQKEANIRLNFSADETLSIAQNLYEKKFITYPRTGSKYIPEDLWQEIPNLLKVLEHHPPVKNAVSKIKWGRLNNRIVNDLKVTDHHGLLITDKIPSALSAKENTIYEMIAFRLLESVSQACSKEMTNVILQVLHHDFMMKGSNMIDPGWRIIKGDFSADNEDAIQDLPELQKNDELKIKNSSLLEKKTKAPALYTEAALLSAMENVGKEIENIEKRKALQNIGIGTPATRAAIIETLFNRDYIRRDKKFLIPTQKGMQVYELIKDKKIADPDMTAEWELALHSIENNEVDAMTFQKEMENYASSITHELLTLTNISEKIPDISCPRCKKQQLLIRDTIAKCPDVLCNWIQFRNICGIQLNLSDLMNLIKNGKTSLIRGMKSKSGKKFDAYIIMNQKGETSFEFEKKQK